MNKIWIALLLMINVNALAQSPAYDTLRDPKNGRLTYKGAVTFSDLDKEPLFRWQKEGREEYRPNKKKISFLRDNLKDYSILIFMGTWCGDSHELIPKLEKVLQVANYPFSHVRMYGVDRAKATKNGEEKNHNITSVPTIILLDKEGKEVGRITETVSKSVEADLAKIIEKDRPTPHVY